MALVSIKNAEHYFWGEKCDGWHLAKSSGLSVIQERVAYIGVFGQECRSSTGHFCNEIF